MHMKGAGGGSVGPWLRNRFGKKTCDFGEWFRRLVDGSQFSAVLLDIRWKVDLSVC